jgi:ketosteroid isomerase-like protein
LSSAAAAIFVPASAVRLAAEALPSEENAFACKSAQQSEIQKERNTMNTKELLDTYYKGFAQKAGWESVISDDFKFIGGDMTKQTPIVGKDAYIQIIKRFSQLFTTMRVKEMMVADDHAYVRANYDYVFPGGKEIDGDVVELWKVKDGKLNTLTIFFDTLTFERLTKPSPKA